DQGEFLTSPDSRSDTKCSGTAAGVYHGLVVIAGLDQGALPKVFGRRIEVGQALRQVQPRVTEPSELLVMARGRAFLVLNERIGLTHRGSLFGAPGVQGAHRLAVPLHQHGGKGVHQNGTSSSRSTGVLALPGTRGALPLASA